MLTPDAQLITALGGTEDVDPDAHIRAFKHTHTGKACHCSFGLAAKGTSHGRWEGTGRVFSLQGRRVTSIFALFETLCKRA